MNPAAPIPVSVIVMTKNEADNIGPCLTALEDLARSLSSTRAARTRLRLARKHDAQVFTFTWDGRYPKKKQWCLENLPFRHGTCCMSMPTSACVRSSRPRFAMPSRGQGWMVHRTRLRMAGSSPSARNDHVQTCALRGRRGRFVEWDDLDATRMWEVEGHYQPVIDGPTATLSSRFCTMTMTDSTTGSSVTTDIPIGRPSYASMARRGGGETQANGVSSPRPFRAASREAVDRSGSRTIDTSSGGATGVKASSLRSRRRCTNGRST